MNKFLLVLIAVGSISQNAFSAPIGRGALSCKDVISSAEGAMANDPLSIAQYANLTEWVEGYLSGVAQVKGKIANTSYLFTNLQTEIMTQCKSFPDSSKKTLANASFEIAKKFLE